MPSMTRANLPGAGAAKITYKSAILWTRSDVVISLAMALKEQVSSMYGRVTKTREGTVITVNIPMYGFWNPNTSKNLAAIMPGALTTPVIGSRLFGTSDNTLVLLAKNGDQITFKNAMVTKMANLKLAANAQIFSGDVTFTCLIANSTAPTASNAVYTIATSATYSEGDFDTESASYFKTLTWTGAWGTNLSSATILTQDGWTVDWEMKTTPDVIDGIGPVDMFIDLVWASASCIPVINSSTATITTLEAAMNLQGTNASVGFDISMPGGTANPDLILTDTSATGSTFTLKQAALVQNGLTFGMSKKRTGISKWETTLGFTSGAPNAIAAVT